VFDGPIYGDNDSQRVFVTPNDDQPIAEVPAAFFKVVSFIGKDKNLAVRAFIAVQDKEALSDKNGTKSRMFSLCTYQVSVKMIEEETGLVFSSALRDANPLFCTIQGDGKRTECGF
jgi:DNA/RNA endonuclease G (NUC1)